MNNHNSITIKFDGVAFAYDENVPIFKDLNLELHSGVTTLVGQNGTGKSTFILLAGGLIQALEGKIYLDGLEIDSLFEREDKNKYISFIYQNMEFESQETIGDLLNQIYENGYHNKKGNSLVEEIKDVFDLSHILLKKTNQISKGELQKTVIAFSLLYGSKIIFMDEPVFALEDHHKEKILSYLMIYAKKYSVSIYYSIHQFDLSKKYSQRALLFHKDGSVKSGLTKEILNDIQIEDAYQIPISLLKKKEILHRALLSGKREDLREELRTTIIN